MESLVRQVPICILWSKNWSGQLGDTILYRIQPLDEHTVQVGYFVYWSTERPWGDNRLTRWLVPALAIDAVYSHLLFVLPGVQRLLYGPGDIEGARVTYRLEGSERLTATSITADEESHGEVMLDLADAVDESGAILLLNDVWSHQLGGRRALAHARAGAQRRCYHLETLRPLTHEVTASFRLGGPKHPLRARPAWRSRR